MKVSCFIVENLTSGSLDSNKAALSGEVYALLFKVSFRAHFAHIVVGAHFAGISAGSSDVPTSGSSRVLTGPLNVRLAPASHPIQTPSARAMVTTGA